MKNILSAIFAAIVLSLVPQVITPTPTSVILAKPEEGSGGTAPPPSEKCVKVGVAIYGTNNCIGNKDGGINDNPIIVYTKQIIRFIGGILILLISMSIVWGAIKYITSAGNPAAIADAKSRITNAIVGFILWILMFGILQILIPGGIVG